MSTTANIHPRTGRAIGRLVPVAAFALVTSCTYGEIVAPTPPPNTLYDLLVEETDMLANRTRLVVRNVQSGAASSVFGLTVDGAMPTVTGDGARIVYVGPSTGASEYDYQDLWTVTRGGQPQRLPLGEGPENSPALSPDGQRVAYIKLNENGEGRLYVANVNGQNERLITPAITYAPTIRYASPSWSPDGTKLLFSAGEPGRLHLWIANADGSAVQQITNQPISDIDGAWSPDGREVAFVRTASPATSQIHIRNLVTGAERMFAFGHRSRHPAWSPDGARIAFVSNMEDNLDLELYTVRADGEGLYRYTWDDARQQSPRWLKR